MLGDIQIAEPGALIGFAGPRVIEQTIREKLPEGFQRAEYLKEHGMVDMVVHRHELRPTLARLCRLLQTRRDVHRIAGRQPFRGACEHLAGVDSDPALDAELRERIPHLDCRSARAQRIVLVRDRHAEHRHHRVADGLLHRAAVRLDDSAHPLEVGRQQRL